MKRKNLTLLVLLITLALVFCLAWANEGVISDKGKAGFSGSGFNDQLPGATRDTLCPDGSLYGQTPHGVDDSWSAVTSEVSPGYVAYDNYVNADGTTDIRFWGINAYNDGASWYTCSENPMPFTITFYADAAGSPGAIIASYDVTITGAGTGLMFAGTYELMEYNTLLTPAPVLGSSPGWVSVVGSGDPNCWFLWISSGDGPGDGGYQWDGATLGVYDYDNAFCLYSTQEECDWQPGQPHKMHFPQLPDETGWAVNATAPVVLADDFMCAETGWIKDIHWWGAWKNGIEGQVDYFVLSLHSDIPADQNPGGYSMPGETLWEMEVPGMPGEPVDPPTLEGWYDPATGEYILDDHQPYFQYNVCLDEPFWFHQEEGTIYWLNISAVISGGALYIPGDVNGDGVVDHTDVDYLNAFLYQGGPPPPYSDGGFYPAADANGDCMNTVGDLTYLLSYLDSGGPAPTYCPQYPPGEDVEWGWKSTQDHWNDDAVWALWGDLNWIDMYEPQFDPITNGFGIIMDPAGNFVQGWGEDHFGTGWYFYPWYDWWNIWFYDHPLDTTRIKRGFIELDIFPVDPGLPMYYDIAVNWATEEWTNSFPGAGPPLPGEDEDLFIGRLILMSSDVEEGHFMLPFELPDYNPEWVSVDIRGFNFDANGVILHDCLPSLDLSFVITGDAPQIDSGACCFYDGVCAYLPEDECIAGQGTWLGVGVLCEGDTNPANGIDDACEDGPFGACCFTVGSCVLHNAANCVNFGGTYLGDGTVCLGDNNGNGIDDACEPIGACCYPDGSCVEINETDCLAQGGTYMGDATVCEGDINPANGIDDACEEGPFGACCFQDGSCLTLSNDDCTNQGGISWDPSQPCQGDGNSNGIDDACEEECDCEPGNCNGDAAINILDINYLIAYLYGGGPAPVPYALCSGDANCDCTINILDISYLIAFLYQQGPPPCSCEQWLINCGPPLRK